LTFVATAISATPVVNSDGVVNSASYAPAILSNGGIAQGSMFVVFGHDLGPPAGIAANRYPLPTTLAGTSVQVTSGATTVSPFLVYTSAGQVAGILPSKTPIGSGSLTVTYNGETSAPVSFRIVERSFGIFTINQAPSAPAVAQNFESSSSQPMNNYMTAAHVGQTVILWGTGLGPIDGADNDAPPAGNVGRDVNVLVSGQPALVLYHGRAPCCAGMDQINFVVPEVAHLIRNNEGCNVPIVVEVDGKMGNFASLAISKMEGATCSDQFGFSASELEKIHAAGRASMGTIRLGRYRSWDGGDATFGRLQADRWMQNSLGTLPYGTCTVGWGYTFGYPGLVGAMNRFLDLDLMDAGPALSVTGPGGTIELVYAPGWSVGSDAPYFNFRANFPPGQYTVTGPGGKDVAAFQATISIPSPPFQWINRDSIRTIERSQDLILTWSGGDPGSLVEITGFSTRFNSNWENEFQSVGFQCTTLGSAGEFVVPAAILSLLPSSGNVLPPGTLSVRQTTRARFQAGGLDFGFIDAITSFEIAAAYQ
jgi:uncharacterized protein (TIGR03437 family)